MVTIREVAQKAGVSIGTVSRVLNNKSGVSQKTRQHVIAISKELGYAPIKRVPSSTSQVTHLGLLIRPTKQSITTDPFYGDIFHGVEKTCQEHQISISFSTLDVLNGRLRSLPAMINDDRISGLVLLGTLPLEVVKTIDTTVRLPIVLVDNYYPNCVWDSVMIDNPTGGYTATKHLIANGHHHITMLSGPDHPSIIEREEGYEEAIRKHELTSTIIRTPDLTPQDGEEGVLKVLRQAPQSTAIFCANDSQAIGALIKLQQLGYNIPDDFSIIGFDNVITGRFTSPPITTIHVDRPSLGKIATQFLINRINDPERAVVKTIVGIKLVERASVGPPRTQNILPP